MWRDAQLQANARSGARPPRPTPIPQHRQATTRPGGAEERTHTLDPGVAEIKCNRAQPVRKTRALWTTMLKGTSDRTPIPDAIAFWSKSFVAAYCGDQHVWVVNDADQELCRMQPDGPHVYRCWFANKTLIVHSGNEAVSTRVEGWSLPSGAKCIDIPLVDGEIAIDEATGRLACLGPESTRVAIYETVNGAQITEALVPPHLELPAIAIAGTNIGFVDCHGQLVISDFEGRTVLTLSHDMSGRDPEEFVINGRGFAALTLAGTHGVGFIRDDPSAFQWCSIPDAGSPITHLVLPDGRRAVAATRERVVLIDSATCTAEPLPGTAPIALENDGNLLASLDEKRLITVSSIAS